MPYQYSRSKIISNFLAFQIAWFACAIWHDTRSIVISIAMLLLLYHAEPWSKVRFKFTLKVALIGVVFDSVLTYFSILSFTSSTFIIPFWLVLLWLLFASTLSVSMKWLMSRPLLAFIAGCIFGPAAYWGGEQFGALFIAPTYGIFVLAFIWGSLMFAFSVLYQLQPNDRLSFSRSSISRS